jgi:hypothetical protein
MVTTYQNECLRFKLIEQIHEKCKFHACNNDSFAIFFVGIHIQIHNDISVRIGSYRNAKIFGTI